MLFNVILLLGLIFMAITIIALVVCLIWMQISDLNDKSQNIDAALDWIYDGSMRKTIQDFCDSSKPTETRN